MRTSMILVLARNHKRNMKKKDNTKMSTEVKELRNKRLLLMTMTSQLFEIDL
jgi:hypothetical protein